MSKTTKNGSGSGGDERNMYIRRYKSTSNPSKASSSNASLAEKLDESEISTRSKQGTNVVKPQGVGKSIIKNKLRSPVKTGLGQPANRVNRHNIVSLNKDIKKTGVAVKPKIQTAKMKQEFETVESNIPKQNEQPENKEPTEEVEKIKQSNDLNHSEVDEKLANHQKNGNANELNGIEVSSEESANETEINKNGNVENNGNVEHNGNTEVIRTEKEEEFNLQLETEENCTKPEDVLEKEPEIEMELIEVPVKETETLNEEVKENPINTESCSVDVVESTTSEVSEATESTVSLENKNKENENQDPQSDVVSYDSSILLKDVKIKLNDCLKDSKAEEENNADQSLNEYAHKEATFGKTLRTISGRNSIGRMRHITVRDRQSSPNSSLFVNTSSASFSEDGDLKILHHRTALSELSSSNGETPSKRKRNTNEDSLSPGKKPKIEETSLLNSSFERLKSTFFRRPTPVSSPNKYESEKLNLSASEEVKADEESGIVKKWCVIM